MGFGFTFSKLSVLIPEQFAMVTASLEIRTFMTLLRVLVVPVVVPLYCVAWQETASLPSGRSVTKGAPQ